LPTAADFEKGNKSVKTKRLTTAQAIVQYLLHQHVERDGKCHPFFAGCLGIFGHGCIAGVGQALLQYPQFRYILTKNEQASVHIAAAFAKMSNRLRTFACVSSIGPGATNMVTGAALATVNRLPVLLLPGDIFARRNVGPVLQQLEHPNSQDISVNDCFRPVSKYWDRINRPDQLMNALPEVMRVLTSCSIILMSITLIAGVYGMNFNTNISPFNMPELNFYFGYPLALLMMITVTVVLVMYFKRRGWL